MICQVIRNKETNEIDTILAPNGKESILYKGLLNITNNKEDAFKLWTKVYTPTFKEWFGDWLDKPQSIKNLDDNGEPQLQNNSYINNKGEVYSVLTNDINFNKVNYGLRSINILQSDKAKEIFSKGEKNNWSLDKILTEVQESDVEAKVRELEKEGLLEIDCKGLKAEKGLQTNFTKGGKWKLVKDLKGYPTHKEGGVDLTIGKDGVKIKNGNTEFTAKHGLVIPKN